MREEVSGFVVDTVDEAVRAVRRALELPRQGCRAYFEDRFTASRMADDYVRIYEEAIFRQRSRLAAEAAPEGDADLTDDVIPDVIPESAAQG